MHSESGRYLGHKSTRNIQGRNTFSDRVGHLFAERYGADANADAADEQEQDRRKNIEFGDAFADG